MVLGAQTHQPKIIIIYACMCVYNWYTQTKCIVKIESNLGLNANTFAPLLFKNKYTRLHIAKGYILYYIASG